MRAFEYFAPGTVGEAAKFLRENEGKAVVLNGGTDVVIQLRDRLINPAYVVDIKRIPGLNELRFSKEEGLHIGACVNMNRLGGDENVRTYYPFLAEAALSVGSKQVRNRATCAGNLINASPLADTSTPLLCLDAVLEVEGPDGKREIPINEFFVFVRKTTLQKDEIVTGIRVPYYEGVQGIFTKVSRRNKVDLSTVCSTVMKHEGKYRAAFGSVAPTPPRLPQTEACLNEGPLDEARIDRAVELALSEVSPIDDVRASKQYRLDVVAMALRRSLESLG